MWISYISQGRWTLKLIFHIFTEIMCSFNDYSTIFFLSSDVAVMVNFSLSEHHLNSGDSTRLIIYFRGTLFLLFFCIYVWHSAGAWVVATKRGRNLATYDAISALVPPFWTWSNIRQALIIRKKDKENVEWRKEGKSTCYSHADESWI